MHAAASATGNFSTARTIQVSRWAAGGYHGADDARAPPRSRSALPARQNPVQFAGNGHANFWDNLDEPRWETLRELARHALDEYGWPHEKPRPYDS